MKECQHCKTCYADDIDTCPTDGMPTMHTISGEPVLEGKYHFESRVGQGGMGVVYKARHAYLKTLHAIKVILPDLVGNDPELVTRFRQEALASAAIRHPNVVAVTDYGVAQGTMPFIVMEFVEGESLHDLLAREQRLSPERALELTSAICDGIGAAHKQGIVHRDMKPLNIMLLKDKKTIKEAVKILDFGLAKIKSGELLGSFVQAQTQGLMGSPYYMAPEQWSDEDLGAQSDIYSIGVMLFQMLAGDVPFKGSSIPAIMKKHLTDPPTTFAEMGVQISPAIERAVMHTLEKDADKRTKTVDELVKELRDAINSSEDQNNTVSQLPVAPLKILTNPPFSSVYLNDVAVGESKEDGWLVLDGVQTGNHRIKVSREGFYDWEDSLLCDGKPQQVVAKLKRTDNSISQNSALNDPTVQFNASQIEQIEQSSQHISNIPNSESSREISGSENLQSSPEVSNSQNPQDVIHRSIPQETQLVGSNTADQSVVVESDSNKSFFSPILIVIIGISGLLLLTAIGGVGIYMSGFIGGTNVNKTPTPTSTSNTGGNATDTPPPPSYKNEMVKITGGEFTMGRNDGTPLEQKEHKAKAGDFWIDQTEVTNGEYYEFIKAAGYEQYPAGWVGEKKKPAKGREKHPVTSVNMADIEEFIKWRSKRDNFSYRLPTEEEWEYVARNGSENTLYPWGDKFKKECAVVGKTTVDTEPVGSKECSATTKWKVYDLVGNVYEWTSSKAKPYPGSPIVEIKNKEKINMIRGGCALLDNALGHKSDTSTFRIEVPVKTRSNRLGFRLVRSN